MTNKQTYIQTFPLVGVIKQERLPILTEAQLRPKVYNITIGIVVMDVVVNNHHWTNSSAVE